jgi:hypothetical protein
MLTNFLQILSRSIPTKEACLHAIIVASTVTSNPIVHSYVFRSQRSRRNNRRKINQALNLSMLIKLLGISGNNIDLFLPADRVTSSYTNPGTSSRSRMSPTIIISMKDY